ncbi:MAG: ATP-binding protein [Pseudomonadota bacterium]
MAEQLTIFLSNNYEELPRLTKNTANFLQAKGFSHKTIFYAELALEEIVTNIIKYGYEDHAPHVISVFFETDSREITIVCEDDGHAFNPLHAPPPDLDAPVLERKVGGLGIHLVKEMMDYVVYRREEGKNIVTMKILDKRCSCEA